MAFDPAPTLIIHRDAKPEDMRDGHIQTAPAPADEPRVLPGLESVGELAALAVLATDALLAILSLPWLSGGPGVRCCPACRVPFGATPGGYRFNGDHLGGCAWLIAAKACGVA